MPILDEILVANEAYAATFGDKSQLALPPARGVAVLTCMDARLDPAKYAGLAEGDAHVIRNAGGRASDDAIRSLVISYKLLGTKEWFVIHHTNCGMEFFTDEVMRGPAGQQPGDSRPGRRRILRRGDGPRVRRGRAQSSWLTISDNAQSVVEDVARIRSHPLVPGSIPIHGYIYDVGTGRLVEVPSATASRPTPARRTGVRWDDFPSSRRAPLQEPADDDARLQRTTPARGTRPAALSERHCWGGSACSGQLGGSPAEVRGADAEACLERPREVAPAREADLARHCRHRGVAPAQERRGTSSGGRRGGRPSASDRKLVAKTSAKAERLIRASAARESTEWSRCGWSSMVARAAAICGFVERGQPGQRTAGLVAELPEHQHDALVHQRVHHGAAGGAMAPLLLE